MVLYKVLFYEYTLMMLRLYFLFVLRLTQSYMEFLPLCTKFHRQRCPKIPCVVTALADNDNILVTACENNDQTPVGCDGQQRCSRCGIWHAHTSCSKPEAIFQSFG